MKNLTLIALASIVALAGCASVQADQPREMRRYMYQGPTDLVTPVGFRNNFYQKTGVQLGKCLGSDYFSSNKVYSDGRFNNVRTCIQWNVDVGTAEFPTGTVVEIDWNN